MWKNWDLYTTKKGDVRSLNFKCPERNKKFHQLFSSKKHRLSISWQKSQDFTGIE